MNAHPLIVIIGETQAVAMKRIVGDHSMEDYNRIGFNKLLCRPETHQVQLARALAALEARGYK